MRSGLELPRRGELWSSCISDRLLDVYFGCFGQMVVSIMDAECDENYLRFAFDPERLSPLASLDYPRVRDMVSRRF